MIQLFVECVNKLYLKFVLFLFISHCKGVVSIIRAVAEMVVEL